MKNEKEIRAEFKQIQAKYHADLRTLDNNQNQFKSQAEYKAAEAKLDAEYKLASKANKAELQLLELQTR